METTRIIKSRSASSKFWCWVLWFPNDANRNAIKSMNKDDIDYIIYGEEKAEPTEEYPEGKPHLQGYVEFANKIRKSGAIEIFQRHLERNDTHFDMRNARTRHPAINYCKKGPIITKTEWHSEINGGTKHPNFNRGWIGYEKDFITRQQGSRTDWADLRDFISENPNLDQVLEQWPDYVGRYSQAITLMINHYKDKEEKFEILSEFQNFMPCPWQTALLNELKRKPDNRKIVWYEDGGLRNLGKSTLAKILVTKFGALFVDGENTSNVAFAWEGQRIVVFDFPFAIATLNRETYKLFEQLKNGLIFSGKYASKMKNYPNPWVVVFANFRPDARILGDRMDLRTLTVHDRPNAGIEESALLRPAIINERENFSL